MELFYHDVGSKGATRDFPKTICNRISISVVEQNVPNNEAYKISLLEELHEKFPSGSFNCWGVPSGAGSIIKNLSVGDAMLLVKTTGGKGEVPILAIVKTFHKYQIQELSAALWGETKFPYIFFFDTQHITLTWQDFKEHVNYSPKFRPSGNVYRVRSDRLNKFGGVEGYLNFLGIKCSENEEEQTAQLPRTSKFAKLSSQDEYAEGVRRTKEYSFFSRNSQLANKAKNFYGYTCQACSFNFKDTYGELGFGYIECHHLNPLSERSEDEWDETIKTSIEDVTVLCANCHRMIHRKRPALTVEELKMIIPFQKAK